jgi:hypothetical protein
MHAIAQARKLIAKQPSSEAAKVLSHLVLALESDQQFVLGDLYKLDFEAFNLAMDVMKDWRLDRYYSGKAKLFDLSYQISTLEIEDVGAYSRT